MDELTKYRVTGAIFWLALLILLVPSWYSDPVVYDQPHSFEQSKVEDTGHSSSTPVQAPKPEVPVALPQVKISKQDQAIKLEESKLPEPKPVQVEKKAEIETAVDAEPSKVTDVVKQSKPSADKTDNLNQAAWLVRVASFNSIEAANKLLATLEMRYQVTIGDFSSADRKVYSVRVGPYYRFDEALQAKQALDEELSTDAVVVKIR